MEYMINIVAVLGILICAANGAKAKALRALLQLFVCFLGVVLAMRYWEIGTRLTTGIVPLLGVAAPLWFGGVLTAFLLLALNLADWIAAKAKLELLPVVDELLGFGFGLATGFVVVCSIAMALSIPLVKWSDYDPGRARYRLHECPLKMYSCLYRFTTGEDLPETTQRFARLLTSKEAPPDIIPEINIPRRAAPEIPPG
jgi:hypothetical protein